MASGRPLSLGRGAARAPRAPAGEGDGGQWVARDDRGATASARMDRVRAWCVVTMSEASTLKESGNRRHAVSIQGTSTALYWQALRNTMSQRSSACCCSERFHQIMIIIEIVRDIELSRSSSPSPDAVRDPMSSSRIEIAAKCNLQIAVPVQVELPVEDCWIQENFPDKSRRRIKAIEVDLFPPIIGPQTDQVTFVGHHIGQLILSEETLDG